MSRESTFYVDALEKLSAIAIALSANRDQAALQTQIIQGAKSICHADGASFYLLSKDQQSLHFQVISNDHLSIHMGGSWSDVTIPPLPMYLDDGQIPNQRNVATAALHSMRTINICDVYSEDQYDLSGTKNFDHAKNYHTLSILTVPMKDALDAPLGVLQIINGRDADGKAIAFGEDLVTVAEAIASQVSVAYTNYQMVQEQKALWESLLQMLVVSIDEKSPYTSGHCARVPILSGMIADAVNQNNTGVYGNATFDEQALYELNVAALMHDVGKLTTPEYVVDKATKLETIYNRIHTVRTRFEVLRRDAEIAFWRGVAQGGDRAALQQTFDDTCTRLDDDFQFIASTNLGNEFITDEAAARVRAVGQLHFAGHFPADAGISEEEALRYRAKGYAFTMGEQHRLLDSETEVNAVSGTELENMLIARGTLNAEERQKIQDHAAVGIRMLKGLPFPQHLKNVLEIAGAHHERLDGKGYPNGLVAEQISLPGRVLAMADIYEALTAADRPYKSAKPQSVCLKIMASMVNEQHLDKDLFVIFLHSGLWQQYGEKYLRDTQQDTVDVEKILAMLD